MNNDSFNDSEGSDDPVGSRHHRMPNAIQDDESPSLTHRDIFTMSKTNPLDSIGMDKSTKLEPSSDVKPKMESAATSDGVPSKKVAGFRSLFTYPRGAYFCLGNEFAERFSFYGMKAILVMYLMTAHGLSGSVAKMVYHAFVFTAYFTPVFGSILADGFLGRYRVILGVSIVYCVGHVLLTLSAIPDLGGAAMKALDYTGLFVIAVATGGIKPCVSAFAADQFPESMAAERFQFFSFFYFMINLGALVSQAITPILRRQPCLGAETCFPLAFGVPAIFMFLATLVFWAGTPFYKTNKVRDNVIWRTCQCVGYAIKEKRRNKQKKKTHWLDYAQPKYDQATVADVKALFNVLLLFIPVIPFWALFEQQGSTWVIQGSRMNGRIGRLTILPDQMGVLNPFLVILLIPVFEGLIYPTLARCNIWTKQLRRMGWGGFLAAFSFIAAALLQLAVDKTAVAPLSGGHSRLTVVNFLQCDVMIRSDQITDQNFTVLSGTWREVDLAPNATVEPQWNQGCGVQLTDLSIIAKPQSGRLVALFSHSAPSLDYQLMKTLDGKTRVYFLFEPRVIDSRNITITVEQDGKTKGYVDYSGTSDTTKTADVEPDLIGSDEYEIFLKSCDQSQNCTRTFLRSFKAESGAAHVLIIPANQERFDNRLIEVIKPNTVPILWQVPQYVIITVGEILFSPTGLAFSYLQASPKMKSVFQAIWLLTSAFGNLIVFFVSGTGGFESAPALEFFVYGGLMGVVMILFVVLAWRYKSTRNEADGQ